MAKSEKFIAHIDLEKNEQPLLEHLVGTAKNAEKFAADFGCSKIGYHCGLLHDIGKYSEDFQKRIRNPESIGRVDHSTAGAMETKPWEAMAIAGHHSGLLDGGNNKTAFAYDGTFWGRLKAKIPDYHAWKEDLSDELNQINEVTPPDFAQKDSFSLAFFIRMLYSCLVDADYLDTEAFMQKDKVKRGEYDEFDTLRKKFDEYTYKWLHEDKQVSLLCAHRTRILKDCLEKGEKLPRGVYTLTVPTGGGKTTASMGFALNQVKFHGCKRIIYVIPYTSIIDQTADVFSGIFGRENVVEHHSGAMYDLDENSSDEMQVKKALATENWDAPIIITTAVQFFESLYANKSSKCRKLHNLSNSVIIFDEAQTLPVPYLKPCIAAIAQLTENYGVTAVLCTATQPALEQYFKEYMSGDIREICENTEEELSVFERVTINNLGKMSIETLKERLRESSQLLCVVNKRATAKELYDYLEGEGVYCLTTLICSVDRKLKFAEIKRRLERGLPCRMISTSLVEAGVDLDFPCVYREEAGLDSLIQAAGRCNREGKRQKEDSKVFSFALEGQSNPHMELYSGALRETWRKYEKVNSKEAITFYFQYYRELLGQENLDEKGIVEIWKNRENLYPFETVAKSFRLIEDNTVTIYIRADDKAQELFDKIKSGYADKAVFRQLGQYGVSLYEYQFQRLREQGIIDEISENVFVLNDDTRYNSMTGLDLGKEPETGIGIMY